MVPSIARQSVIIKCNMQKSVLTGNYEFYYAPGLAAKLFGLAPEEEIRPKELTEFLAEHLKGREPGEEREAWLLHLLSGYKPTEEYDGLMKELLLMGETEAYLWTVQLPAGASDISEKSV